MPYARFSPLAPFDGVFDFHESEIQFKGGFIAVYLYGFIT